VSKAYADSSQSIIEFWS